MKHSSLPQPHEQSRLEMLLIKLAKIQPISAKPAPISTGKVTLKTA
jgi:hypothetical protein